eukprot:CAMPEP_0114578924 /NCGR_PEP_ID=MMETSP0125-20121206/3396_1 /TAXON_ID=485358 ORGANISM="Aristerostoma sp., Strain ATCC 50986" /NCGR_SAMPLE_ID=MMETSP0125 /ASSEMBLY_ACC=CAM_ASM_000245 /LENGTH=47 /DNA_ID= /DNA_START= /DNA_END= /DNA_ORIENTATION=
MKQNDTKEAISSFDDALASLDFHLGESHPLHSTVYSILGYYHVEKGN